MNAEDAIQVKAVGPSVEAAQDHDVGDQIVTEAMDAEAAPMEPGPPPRIDPLVGAGLRYGSLVRIDSQFQADRYNRVLDEFGLAQAAKVPFHVDISGYSVEVAMALGDLDYLDQNGANRRFVIVTNRQAAAPLVNATFSCEKAMLQYFFAANEAAIAKITLHNVLYGEIENYAYRFASPHDVTRLRQVTFDCHALDGFFVRQNELRDLVHRFADYADRSVRHDETRIERMIALAKAVGDVRSSSSELVTVKRPWPAAFSTRLFGGATFIDIGEAGGAVVGDPASLAMPDDARLRVIDVSRDDDVVGYLRSAGHLEKFDPDFLVNSGFLIHRLRTLAADIILDAIGDADGKRLATEGGIENAIRRHLDRLCSDRRFTFLSALREQVKHDRDKAAKTFRTADAALQSSVMRARPDWAATGEVNRILARLNAFDPVTLFSLDKDAFYRCFAKASPSRQAYMLGLVEAVYMPDADDPDRKSRLKARFFG